jgi:hypothetical protein
VPWCEPCGKFYSPNTLHPDGTCPDNHPVADAAPPGDQAEPTKVPWHLWLLVVAVVVYLGWRLIELIVWLVT